MAARVLRYGLQNAVCLSALLLLPGTALAQGAPLPEIEVITTSPVPGGGIERDRIPSNAAVLGPADFDTARSSSLPEALLLNIPSVYINDASGNFFQPDVQYRGFLASPVLGTPQGLAVYQNGVRVNESFGDTVNWDFIPAQAINRLTLVPSNPVYGLNALGGALSIEMKNGFNYHGGEIEVKSGSFGRRGVAVQTGGRQGNVAGYVAADALNDNGWRDRSPSSLRRLYADLGVRDERVEFNVNFSGASNMFGATAPAPIELLQRRWSSVYTTPQTTQHELAFLTAAGSYKATDTLTVKSNVYYRGFRQRHTDGNTSDVLPCDPAVSPGFLCFGEPDIPLLGTTGPVPDFLGGATPGSLDRTSTVARSYGGSLQANSSGRVFDRNNNVVVGMSVDRGNVLFAATSELGTISPDLFVTGTGVIISQPSGDVAPVKLRTTNTYTGLYATDTLDLTPEWSVTAGGRFNIAQIRLDDQLGTALNGSHEFMRLNPVIGTTYKIAPNMTVYAGYSEANRAPTPAELGCADPIRPCLLNNFLASDPPLKQVVSRTVEAGIRGNFNLGAENGKLVWNVGAFRAENSDDILTVPSAIMGRGFFQNAGTTLRQGIEASAAYTSSRWNARVSYSVVDATFQDTITLASPNNLLAVGGLITIEPGNHLPAIPKHRLKASADYLITPEWKVGFDAIVAGGQYLVGDESNLNPMLPGYFLVNFNTTYKLSKNVELFGLVQNLFNRRYYTYGAFFDTGAIPFLSLTDPRTVSPGAPLAAYAGLRARF
jgi:iron complex outermembrane receptor protein